MRIRYMELPTVVVGEVVETPFVVIVDKVSPEEFHEIDSDHVTKMTGARGTLVSRAEVELGSDDA